MKIALIKNTNILCIVCHCRDLWLLTFYFEGLPPNFLYCVFPSCRSSLLGYEGGAGEPGLAGASLCDYCCWLHWGALQAPTKQRATHWPLDAARLPLIFLNSHWETRAIWWWCWELIRQVPTLGRPAGSSCGNCAVIVTRCSQWRCVAFVCDGDS